MGTLTVQAAEGLKNAVKTAYGYSDDQAYRHIGISSMNGITDVRRDGDRGRLPAPSSTTRSSTTWRGFTFWSVNRDRPCTGGGADTCSGVSQQAWDFTRVFAQYRG